MRTLTSFGPMSAHAHRTARQRNLTDARAYLSCARCVRRAYPNEPGTRAAAARYLAMAAFAGRMAARHASLAARIAAQVSA